MGASVDVDELAGDVAGLLGGEVRHQVADVLQLLPNVPYIEPDDISNAVLFLASEESRYVTGEFISVDAGAHLKLLE